MEINRDKFRAVALMIALAAQSQAGCIVVHDPPRTNLREEQTSWTGTAPRPVQPAVVSPVYEGYAPTSEYYPPPVYEAGYGPTNEYYPPPAYEGYGPVNEYGTPVYE
jgi:hypothetical protein